MRRILSVTIKTQIDDSPDLSYLGKYSDTHEDGCIDRAKRGERSNNEYRYFIPAMTGEQTGNLNSPEEDYQRMEAYVRNEWSMLGITAEAQVILADEVVQTIRSGGLWGVESDSGEDYFEEIEEEELSSLKTQLLACGFSEKEVMDALLSPTRVSE